MKLPRHAARRLGAILAAAIVVYAGDALSLALDFPKRPPRSTVHVRRYYAVKLKNGNTEFLFDEPADAPCVNSLFPHGGYAPCWYLARHNEQRVNVDAGPSRPWINTP